MIKSLSVFLLSVITNLSPVCELLITILSPVFTIPVRELQHAMLQCSTVLHSAALLCSFQRPIKFCHAMY
jgi:hypothetical protein